MHYEGQANIIFYLVAAISVIILLAGLFGMVNIWRLGKAPTLNTNIKKSKWISSFITAAFLETQILEYSVLAWVSHMMIFWGFISLLMLTSAHFFLIWFVPEASSLFQYFKFGNGIMIMAVWGDFWGLALLTGILIALYRRYIIKPEYQNTISEDVVAIWLLFVITVTGFMCEAVRLSVASSAHDAAYSFAVYWVVPYLSGLKLTQAYLTGMFWIHSVVSLAFLIYIPFSNFKHMFASPLDYAFVTSGSRYAKEVWSSRTRDKDRIKD